jgi:hypothetical protein
MQRQKGPLGAPSLVAKMPTRDEAQRLSARLAPCCPAHCVRTPRRFACASCRAVLSVELDDRTPWGNRRESEIVVEGVSVDRVGTSTRPLSFGEDRGDTPPRPTRRWCADLSPSVFLRRRPSAPGSGTNGGREVEPSGNALGNRMPGTSQVATTAGRVANTRRAILRLLRPKYPMAA